MEATEWLTTALVIITGVYAWLTRQVVVEAKKTREQQVRPHLKLHVTPAGAGIVFPTIVSTGPGAAVDVRATLIATHRQGDGQTVITLTRRFMAAGDSVELLLKDPVSKTVLAKYTEVADRFSDLRLVATTTDVLGKPHTVEDAIEDVPAWFEAWGATWTRMRPNEAKRAADALVSIDTTLKHIEPLSDRRTQV